MKKKKTKYEDRDPRLTLEGKNYLSELKDCHVGDIIDLKIRAKLTRKTEGGYEYELMDDEEREDTSKKMSADFPY